MFDDIISDIIDNIKFFTHKIRAAKNSPKKINTIYEYGNYDLKIEYESVALLIFYGFHILINLSEIGKELILRYQYFKNIKKEFKPKKIENNEREKQKDLAILIETKLFGHVLIGLTIKETLFILNEDNYLLGLNKFKEGFLNCNKKDFDLIVNDNLNNLLEELEINQFRLFDFGDAYYYPLERNTGEEKVYILPKRRHPLCFYFKDKK